MIGRLHGVVLEKAPPQLLLDVQGVAYEVEAPMTTFYDLPAVGQPFTLYTHLIVREDAHLLFGFSRPAQRHLFRSLIKVNGIGPRVALAILSGLSDEEFLRCLAQEDVARLTQVPGIGRKTAERLLVELRDKVLLDSPFVPADTGAAPAADPANEAVSALVALGFKPQEASRAVQAVAHDGADSEHLIREALKGMVR